MMPSKQLFASAMDICGITNNDHIIIYGAKDCVSFKSQFFICILYRNSFVVVVFFIVFRSK